MWIQTRNWSPLEMPSRTARSGVCVLFQQWHLSRSAAARRLFPNNFWNSACEWVLGLPKWHKRKLLQLGTRSHISRYWFCEVQGTMEMQATDRVLISGPVMVSGTTSHVSLEGFLCASCSWTVQPTLLYKVGVRNSLSAGCPNSSWVPSISAPNKCYFIGNSDFSTTDCRACLQSPISSLLTTAVTTWAPIS